MMNSPVSLVPCRSIMIHDRKHKHISRMDGEREILHNQIKLSINLRTRGSLIFSVTFEKKIRGSRKQKIY